MNVNVPHQIFRTLRIVGGLPTALILHSMGDDRIIPTAIALLGPSFPPLWSKYDPGDPNSHSTQLVKATMSLEKRTYSGRRTGTTSLQIGQRGVSALDANYQR